LVKPLQLMVRRNSETQPRMPVSLTPNGLGTGTYQGFRLLQPGSTFHDRAAGAARGPLEESAAIVNIVFMDFTELNEFAARYTVAWCSQHAAGVASFFEEQGTLKINNGTPAVGRAAITDSAQSFMSAFPDLVVRMDRLDVKGAKTEYHWTLTGNNTGPGGTGSFVRIGGFEEWRFGPAGLIAESLGHFDESDYQRQLSASGRRP
jgi:hypothetical protein